MLRYTSTQYFNTVWVQVPLLNQLEKHDEMGIRGLSSYLRHHSLYQTMVWPSDPFQENQEAQNQMPLIVDGASVLHQLMDWTPAPYMQPSYSDFMARTARFFQLLTRVGFGPIHVWMDGATDQQKLATGMRRECEKWERLDKLTQMLLSHDRFEYDLEYSRGQRVKGMLGHCSYAAFMHAVMYHLPTEFNVKLHCALGEADHNVARHAFELNAFVLSSDSDFVVYNCPRGWISMNSLILDGMLLNPRFPIPSQFSIVGQLYTRNILARHIGIHPDVVPLFGCLAGNDYFEQGHFFRQTTSRGGDDVPWRKSSRHLDSLIPFVRNILKNCKIADVALQTLQQSLSSSPEDVAGLLTTLKQYNQFEIEEDETYRCKHVDSQIMKKMTSGQLEFQLFDTILSGQFVCSIRMGVTKGPSAYDLFANIRRVLYTLLLCDRESTVEVHEYSKPLLMEKLMRRDDIQLCTLAEMADIFGDVIDSETLSIKNWAVSASKETRLRALFSLFQSGDEIAINTGSIHPRHIPIVLMARYIISQQPGYLRNFELLALILSSSSANTDNQRNQQENTNPITVPCLQLLSLWDCALYHLLMSMQVLQLNDLIHEWALLDKVNPPNFYYYLSVLRRGRSLRDVCNHRSKSSDICHDEDEVKRVYQSCIAGDLKSLISQTFDYGF